MNSSFFDSNHYIIDEKVNFFKFENCYKVYNSLGHEIGSVNQKIPAFQKILRLLLNKNMLPFLLEIKDSKGHTQSSISRGWTFLMSKIAIKDSTGNPIGFIKQKFSFFKPTFNIYDQSEQLVAVINGDWKAWNFKISNSSEKQIGTISKKWNGAMKEIFTSADKYNVELNSEIIDTKSKIAILSGAITIDMVLKESK